MKYATGCILQFAKTPELGKVKTRLIPSITATKALALHRRLLERTLAMCLTSELCPVELWFSEFTEGNEGIIDIENKYQPVIRWQQGGDLGERMAHAANTALQRYEFVILIGSDCPVLDAEYLEMAVQRLMAPNADKGTAVIGPAEDGGYVLLGLRQVDPLLFAGIDWGSSQVFVQTLERLQQLGWQVAELPVLWDVDRPQDLSRLRAAGITPA